MLPSITLRHLIVSDENAIAIEITNHTTSPNRASIEGMEKLETPSFTITVKGSAVILAHKRTKARTETTVKQLEAWATRKLREAFTVKVKV